MKCTRLYGAQRVSRDTANATLATRAQSNQCRGNIWTSWKPLCVGVALFALQCQLAVTEQAIVGRNCAVTWSTPSVIVPPASASFATAIIMLGIYPCTLRVDSVLSVLSRGLVSCVAIYVVVPRARNKI